MAKQFVLDLNKCTGCQACQMACIMENEIPLTRSWRHVETFNPGNLPDLPVFHLSLACNHCAEAPCMEYCPTMAYYRDKESGAVLINSNFCIGCTYCSWVCPYGAPQYISTNGVMEKCNFCIDRLNEGKDPACVTLCPTDALQIEERPEIHMINLVPGFTEVGILPGIRIIPLNKHRKRPIISENPLSTEEQQLMAIEYPKKSKVSLKNEWTLVIFTLLMAWLSGLSAKFIVEGKLQYIPYLLLLGLGGIVLSSFHLGKTFRAYRAINNWRKSWLSREILFLNLFLFLMAFQWFTKINNFLLDTAIIISSFLMLISIDMVYLVAQTEKPTIPHSAQVTLTGFFVLSMGLHFQMLATMVGLLKLFLYVSRKLKFGYCYSKITWPLCILRILAGFIIPFYLLFFVCGGDYCIIVWSGVVLGELIDRIEFYMEMEIKTPARQIVRDMKAIG